MLNLDVQIPDLEERWPAVRVLFQVASFSVFYPPQIPIYGRSCSFESANLSLYSRNTMDVDLWMSRPPSPYYNACPMLSPFHPSTTCCSPISLPLLYFYSSSSFISHNSSSACLNRYNISHIEKRVYSLFSCTSRNSSDSRLYDSLSSHCYSRDNSFWCPNHCILLSLPTNESSSCLGACLAVADSVICFS